MKRMWYLTIASALLGLLGLLLVVRWSQTHTPQRTVTRAIDRVQAAPLSQYHSNLALRPDSQQSDEAHAP